MARGRKSTKIKAVKNTEKAALQCLWKTGVATKGQLEEYFDLHSRRLSNFKSSKFISIDGEVVTLNKEGIKYCEKELGLKYRYTPNVSHISHDLMLTNFYLRLDPKTQDSWKTENEIRETFKHKGMFLLFKQEIIDKYGDFKATPDAAIIDPRTGEYVGVDYITRNYSESDIEQKMAFCNQFFSGMIRF